MREGGRIKIPYILLDCIYKLLLAENMGQACMGIRWEQDF